MFCLICAALRITHRILRFILRGVMMPHKINRNQYSGGHKYIRDVIFCCLADTHSNLHTANAVRRQVKSMRRYRRTKILTQDTFCDFLQFFFDRTLDDVGQILIKPFTQQRI